MSYNYSQIDRDNLNWFSKDTSKATLLSIELFVGRLRGLNPFEIKFNYPISVIAGKNGSGKSTLLALAACSFHNDEGGFKLLEREKGYYTFSDFFIQSKEEVSPDGIVIGYKILHNNWTPTKKMPRGIGAGLQFRKKKVGGNWNKYSKRVHRNVVYFGIDRVVPHSEKSVSKSYKNRFKNIEFHGWEESVKNIVGRILNKNYDEFWYKKHTKYQLPMVRADGKLYSGFNMGAGENALFKIFSTVHSCPDGALFIIDEIELGLHEEAQKRLVDELKKICKQKHIQIICTTHSSTIMSNLPPEARFFVESIGTNTIVSPGISSLYAAGKLAGENSNELDIFVEDSTAKCLIESSLSNETRLRVNILTIGSSSAVIRQLAARYKNIKKGECIAILDGDKYSKLVSLCNQFLKMLENAGDKEVAESYVKERLKFLPGDTWPEKWIFSELKQKYGSELAAELSLDDSLDEVRLSGYLDEAIRAGKHNEFQTICQRTNLGMSDVKNLFCRSAVKCNKESFEEIKVCILSFLE
ncbi:hypothetical protein MSMTP_3167 [Methanosarcina sp. MTP4]|uniref:ATP-dependent nuclease n=1 Tax=Methanosarcina sp. MTP4 TaxID=1434100 RepID=UPI000615E633|nr:ATP-binding protein [Methanosarcina sp. MTP4]AKB26636.1 hypothetical protein MSMTP_3167 [Methanosarcina sp. MTP4]